VLEREPGVGGSPVYHPSCQGTPLPLRELEGYLGFDISPCVEPIREIKEIAGGRAVSIPPRSIHACFLERGPGPSSLESHLYRLALEAGVEFRFSSPVLRREDFLRLPRGSIVATGLHREGFEAAGVPYLVSHHLVHRTSCEPRLNFVHLYHEPYTSDYGYAAAFRGILYLHLFNRRRPIRPQEEKEFADRLAAQEGIEVPAWSRFTLPLPVASPSTPRLFSGPYILAGSLAGAVDPFALFGLLGALVSGRIAALAVEDPVLARQEFRKCVHLYRKAYFAARLKDVIPAWVSIPAYRFLFSRFDRLGFAQRALLKAMPGYGNLLSPPQRKSP